MRRLIDKVFGTSNHSVKEDHQIFLPDSFSDAMRVCKRGFFAKKLAEYIGMHPSEASQLFYYSLSKISIQKAEKEKEWDFILYLCEILLVWSEQQKNIVDEIKKLDLNREYMNALLKLYDNHKFELNKDLSSSDEIDCKITNCIYKTNDKWDIYRDVLYAATQKKFSLIKPEEVEQYRSGDVLCEGIIKTRMDIPTCRNLAKESLQERGVSSAMMMSWLLVLSEAITNIIKHAEEGKMTIIDDRDKNEIRFIIEDCGPGFSLHDLPNQVLLEGYSTKKSLGQGFTLMMKIAEKILLSTTSKGSTIILNFKLENPKEGLLNVTG